MRPKIVLCATLALGLGTGPAQDARKNPTLDGSWTVVEVQTVRQGGHVAFVTPGESLVLFAGDHYSFCWTSHRPSARAWQIADSERVSRFNSTLINAGTYEISDSILVTHARFALVPAFVGGAATYRVAFAGDTLILTGTDVLSGDGIQHPLYAGGGHILNKLLRLR